MTDPRAMTVVITGASSGIGLATALAFARHGARLVLAARSQQPLDDAVQACRRQGAAAVAVPADVSSAEDMQALADAASLQVPALVMIGTADRLVDVAAARGFHDRLAPPVQAYLARLGERPAYQRAMEKAQPLI